MESGIIYPRLPFLNSVSKLFFVIEKVFMVCPDHIQSEIRATTPTSFYFEPSKFPLWRFPLHTSRIYLGSTRSALDNFDEPFQNRAGAFCDCFHLIIAQIVNPSDESKVSAGLQDEGTKTDTLDAAGYPDMNARLIIGLISVMRFLDWICVIHITYLGKPGQR
jgi:hypothetical protein